MAHRRRITKGLDHKQVREMNEAWRYAPLIQRPLNRLISVRPIAIDELRPEERCNLFASFRNKLGVYARLHGFHPTYIWSREIAIEGTGEHIHVLMYVPPRHHTHFEDTLIGWWPGPAEMDVREANQKSRFSWDGKRLSAIGYICKQMTSQAWYKRGLIRKPGGEILGKRGGMTENLAFQSREAFWAARGSRVREEPRRGKAIQPATPLKRTASSR